MRAHLIINRDGAASRHPLLLALDAHEELCGRLHLHDRRARDAIDTHARADGEGGHPRQLLPTRSRKRLIAALSIRYSPLHLSNFLSELFYAIRS